MLYYDVINKLQLKVEEEFRNWLVRLTKESFEEFLKCANQLQNWINLGEEHPEDMDWLDKIIDEEMLRKGG
jgi:hypothetical protein